jgi:hypothetical protein
LSRLVLTSAIAVVSALTPSWAGLTLVRASSDDLSAATSAQAVVGAAGVGEVGVGAAVVAGGLVWLGPEQRIGIDGGVACDYSPSGLDPQLTQSNC